MRVYQRLDFDTPSLIMFREANNHLHFLLFHDKLCQSALVIFLGRHFLQCHLCRHGGISPEIMAYGYHRGINEYYASTSSESSQIKNEHQLEEYATFQLHKAVIRHCLRKIRLHRTLDEEQVVVLKLPNVPKWKYNKIVMISLSDNEAWRRLRLTPLLSSSKFPVFSALKCGSSDIWSDTICRAEPTVAGRREKQSPTSS